MADKKLVIRNRLRELMAIKGRKENRYISQRQLASELGLSKVTVDRWARNDVTRMDDDIIIAICRYFDIQPGDLIVMEEVPDDDPGQEETPLAATA